MNLSLVTVFMEDNKLIFKSVVMLFGNRKLSEFSVRSVFVFYKCCITVGSSDGVRWGR